MEQKKSSIQEKQGKTKDQSIKNIFILCCLTIFILSCQNETKNKASHTNKDKDFISENDSLPEAKWNGEYLKVIDTTSNKITKRQSLGSSFLRLGDVQFYLEKHDSISFHLFEGKFNVLSFNTNNINAIIKSSTNQYVHLKLSKNNIITQAKGTYKIQENDGTSLFITLQKDRENEQKFTLQNGNIEVLEFSPKLGRLKAKIKGQFTSKEKDKIQGEGIIDMHFDNYVFVP